MFYDNLAPEDQKTKMDTQKSQVADRLNSATNILVTVSASPSVDQLAGAIGLTLLLNKLDKHATTVFSGKVPPTIDFLQPEKTIEKTTDSLRDFIIALDKSKADKLRYKVEDDMVKIFITPYMTSISEKDLEFSQGDFNVDVIVALGVGNQQDLDQAVTSHGRILHDATLIGINTQDGTALGSINWNDPAASSLCEMLAQLGVTIKADIFDAQMATALLTGVVAETNRFSNEKTSAETMQVSSKLMAAGANQQLVASQLQPPVKEVNLQEPDTKQQFTQDQNEENASRDDGENNPAAVDGMLSIDHEELKSLGLDSELPPDEHTAAKVEEKPEWDESDENETEDPDESDEASAEASSGYLVEPIKDSNTQADEASGDLFTPPVVSEPYTAGAANTASTEPENLSQSTDMPSPAESSAPLLSHDTQSNSAAPASEEEPKEDETVPLPEVPAPQLPQAEVDTPQTPDAPAESLAESHVQPPALLQTFANQPAPQTLADLERNVSSAQDLPPAEPVIHANPDTGVGAARDAVSQAMSGTAPHTIQPLHDLTPKHMDLNLGDIPAVNTSPASAFADTPSAITNPSTTSDVAVDSDEGLPSSVITPDPVPNQKSGSSSSLSVVNPAKPPPVPPPLMPPPMSPPAGSDDPTVM